MTLLVASMDGSAWWFILIFPLWVIHVLYHESSNCEFSESNFKNILSKVRK